MELNIRLIGTRPMLQHNGRLANPIDPWTRRLGELTAKRKKTDEDLVAIMQTEARGACWETDDGMMGIPNAAVWRCIYDAAKAFKLGEDIKRALAFEDITVPAIVGEGYIPCDKFLSQPGNIDYRPVKVQKAKTMRARPKLTAWASEHTFELLTDVLDARDLAPVLERAGRLVGIGDWRPTYGTFRAEVID